MTDTNEPCRHQFPEVPSGQAPGDADARPPYGRDELALFHALLDRAHDPIFLVDTHSGVLLEANQAAIDLLGLSKVDQAWRSLLEGFSVVRQDPLPGGLDDVPEGETHEVAYAGRSGEMRLFELTLSTMYIDGHRYTVGVARDITERKKTETALCQSERQLRTLFETAPVGIFTTTASGRHLFSNEANAVIHGYDSPEAYQQAIGGEVLDLYVDPGEREELLRRLRRDGAVQNFENRHRKKDGTTVWIAVWAKLRRDDRTGEERIEGFCIDITARKKAEEKIRQAREYLNSVVNAIGDPIFVKDEGHRFALVNDALCALVGRAREEILGRTDEDFFPPEQVAVFWQVDDAVLATGGEHISEEHLTTGEGELRTIVTKKTRYVDALGHNSVVGVIRDITERIRLQEMMIQSEKMASVGGLAAGMAHEINNPLSSILQAAQVCLMQLDPALPANQNGAKDCGCTVEAVRCYLEKRRVFKFLAGIQEAGRRAAGIVSSMLEFSRKSESRRAPADVNAIMDRSLELASTDYDLKKNYDFRHITIVRRYGQNLPEITCTRTEIEQVLLNLLKNAAQAMAGHPPSQGAPTIVLGTSRTETGVRIEVRDNGPGMADTVRRRVFEPFFTTKEPGLGTGLGLAVSYFIVTANHGGTISVESEPGKGATFLVELPVEKRP
ncbi:MAG: PAS domain S-box protein [Solidesulfovibrio sp. DCME]|uniref:PAS domain S-box protein n=1 Tax=Solidesulfovibrio sp. DCME TaxID=3447380 RepID=UPI003D116FCA